MVGRGGKGRGKTKMVRGRGGGVDPEIDPLFLCNKAVIVGGTLYPDPL